MVARVLGNFAERRLRAKLKEDEVAGPIPARGFFFCKGLYKSILQIVPAMTRLLLLFLVFSALVFSSCAVNEESSPLPQEVIPEAALPQVPAPPAAEEKLPQVGEAGGNGSVGRTVKEPEISYPFMGSDDAPLTVIEYGDFSDSASSFAAISQVASIKRDYVVSNKVKLVFKPFPLSGTDEAKMASEASLCMWEQGSIQFWAYQKTLFTFYYHLGMESLNNYASRIPNIDKPVFTACLDSRRHSETVEAALREGRQLGIEKTPAFVIGDNVLEGDVPYKKLKSAIDAELGSGDASLITGSAVFSQVGFYEVPKTIVEFVKSVFRKI